MKKKILVTLMLAVVLSVTVLACACTIKDEITLTSYTAEQCFDNLVLNVWKEDAKKTWDVETTNSSNGAFEIKKFDEGTDFLRFMGMRLDFASSSSILGSEVGVLQFDIIADRDVNGYLYLRYMGIYDASMNCVAKERFDYSLKANEKKTFTIDFDKNFVVTKKHCVDLTFKTDINENNVAWPAWTQAKYSISNWEFGLNE